MPRYDTYAVHPDEEVQLAAPVAFPDPGFVAPRPYSRIHDDGLTLYRTYAGEAGSPAAFMAAFDFFQRHANGRYSDRTLMALSRWSQFSTELVEGRPRRTGEGIIPAVFSLAKEVTYDEDTEVKSGGTVGMAVTLPAEVGAKLVLAVAPDMRRNGYGRALLEEAGGTVHHLHTWVSSMNRAAMQFLLSASMRPIAMNRRSAVMFAWDEMPDDSGVAS